MAIELGKAYVQILPSAKGISGSIQKAIAPEATAAGKVAGRNIASAISESLSKAGSTMTKYITTPAMAATTAVTGLVGALGFKRLVGMDEAQAKLKGLGIQGKQLEIVMKNARDAVTGTTFTLADGASVAAGALAAGVKEGKELERYIRIVGDAAVGANVPMMEMAQIFNRIQGTGKITRTELDMLEYRLPGFSQALMKHVGEGSREAFFEMVRAGEVSTKDVLDTMEGFAGGMSAAYAETWSGLKDNILANIGIIGEALLEGLFEDGKKGMAEFLQYLRESEGLKEWARNTGETLRNAFAKIVEAIKNAINWWSNLSDGAKKAFLTLGSIAVTIGPVLLIIGKLITAVINVVKWFGLVKAAAGVLVGAIGAISTPVLIVIGAITALVAAGVALWKNWDKVKEIASNLWDNLATGFTFVKDKVVEFFTETVPEQFNKFIEFITELPGKVMGFLNQLFLEDIPYAVGYGIGFLVEKASEGIANTIEFFKKLPERIKEFLSNAIKNMNEFAKNAKNKALEAGKNIFNSIVDTVKKIPSQMLSLGKDIIMGLVNGVKNSIGSVVNIAKDIASNFVSGFKKAMGIKSPSRVAAGLMGDVLAGFGVGFDKNENVILDQAKDFIGDLIDVFSEKFSFDFEANFKEIVDQDEIVSSVVGRPALATNDGYNADNTNVQIVIENMNVRDEQDIHKISRELQRIIDQNKRGRGFR